MVSNSIKYEWKPVNRGNKRGPTRSSLQQSLSFCIL